MVNSALSIGGLLGVGLSAAFVYWQVGRYAAPQVPRTLFDERKEFMAYTVGLFAGVPLSLFLIFYVDALGNGALVAAFIDLVLLVLGGEIGQWFLLRTLYFGRGESGAFYALGLRAGVSGILILALVAQYFSGPTLTALGIVVLLAQAVAVLIIQVAAGLLAVPSPARLGRLGGSPLGGGLFAAFGYIVLGLGILVGEIGALFGALLAAAGGVWVYQRLRDTVLSGLLPPPGKDEAGAEPGTTPYGRISR